MSALHRKLNGIMPIVVVTHGLNIEYFEKCTVVNSLMKPFML